MTGTKSSQDMIDEFWKTCVSPKETSSKAAAVLPPNVYAQMVEQAVPTGRTSAQPISESYEIARRHCEQKVSQIIKEGYQINQKYSDPFFNLGSVWHCSMPLQAPSDSRISPCWKRISDIFDDPQFFVDGATATDIRQGLEGDCWFLSAVAALVNVEPSINLIEKLCVKWDQNVGVYGFVLYRDGVWISVIIDDKLYLRSPDFENLEDDVRKTWEDNRVRIQSAEEYRNEFQTNSRALFYAQSTDPNETWVPLLEKAFAKAHGDHGSLNGGSVGEGIEDLTGGVSVNILPQNVLNRDQFWDDLLRVNKEFLFGCGTPFWDDDSSLGRDGIHGLHAYSILRAVEYEGNRLLMIKNPWGRREWNGPWSDGSAQWTAKSIKDLEHRFGDDGIFWIPYKALFEKFDVIYRTRLFNDVWRVTQQWVSLTVPWSGEYQDSRFEIEIAKAAPTVIVLSQLDDRYFRGLRGQYSFRLSFRVHKMGEEDYIISTWAEQLDDRSVSIELDLEAGKYDVVLKITGTRNSGADKIEQVIKDNWLLRREKLLQVGLSHDLAHAKAFMPAGSHEKILEDNITKETSQTIDQQRPGSKAEGGTVRDSFLDLLQRGIRGLRVERDSKSMGESHESHSGSTASIASTLKKREIEDEKEDPWAASCVVGLRVFCKDADATIRIVNTRDEIGVKPGLDVDDPARDAAEVVTPSDSED